MPGNANKQILAVKLDSCDLNTEMITVFDHDAYEAVSHKWEEKSSFF